MRRIHPASLQAERLERLGKDGKQLRNIFDIKELVASGIGSQAQVYETLCRRVVGEEINHAACGEQLAFGDIQVSDPGRVGDRHEGRISDASAGDIKVRQPGKPGKNRLKNNRRQCQALVKREAANRQLRRPIRRHYGREGILEECRSASAKVQGLYALETQKQLPQHIRAQILVDVLLDQELLKIGSQLKASEQGLGSQVAGQGSLGGRGEELRRVEVAEVESSDDCAQRLVLGDMGQELVEDSRVGDRNLAVQRAQGSKMQCLGCQQQRHEIDIAPGYAVRGNVEDEETDDGACRITCWLANGLFPDAKRGRGIMESGRVRTQNFDRKPLDGSLTRPDGDISGSLWRTAPDVIQDGQVSEAPASKLALNLDSLPSLEAVGGGNIAAKPAVGLGHWGTELGLDHVEGVDLVESRRARSDLGGAIVNNLFVDVELGDLGVSEGLGKRIFVLADRGEGRARRPVGRRLAVLSFTHDLVVALVGGGESWGEALLVGRRSNRRAWRLDVIHGREVVEVMQNDHVD